MIKRLIMVSVLTAFAACAQAKPHMYGSDAPAAKPCMIPLNTSDASTYANTQYIRMVWIENSKPASVRISFASNYDTAIGRMAIMYPSAADAQLAMSTIINAINNCNR